MSAAHMSPSLRKKLQGWNKDRKDQDRTIGGLIQCKNRTHELFEELEKEYEGFKKLGVVGSIGAFECPARYILEIANKDEILSIDADEIYTGL